MCGIFGIISGESVAQRIHSGLKRVEYRGYDSAGIVTLQGGEFHRHRATGKLENLEKLLSTQPLPGTLGIGHTRWATHGPATEANAHPHIVGDVALIHNGIIENYDILRDELLKDNYSALSDTDSEIVALLLSRERDRGVKPFDAVRNVLERLTGAYSLAIIFKDQPDELFIACHGSPLVIGIGEEEYCIGSDALTVAPLSRRLCYLRDGDWAVISRVGILLFNHLGEARVPEIRPVEQNAIAIEKGNFRHFMEKEVFEQPEAIHHCISHYVDPITSQFRSKVLRTPWNWNDVSQLYITACGTAYFAGLCGRYLFEELAALPVEIDVSSEFRYRHVAFHSGGAGLAISQSGETADTLKSLEYFKFKGIPTAALVNVMSSTMARLVDVALPLNLGPEICVASTKAFSGQVAGVTLMAIQAGMERGHLDKKKASNLLHHLLSMSGFIADVLKIAPQLKNIAHELHRSPHMLYLGRGIGYAVAQEGALKMKELTYIHAQAYAAGELKHGPLALVDEDMWVIVVVPPSEVVEKTISNIQEVAARGGKIICIADKETLEKASSIVHYGVEMPKVEPIIAAVLYTIPLQLLAYYTAVHLGTDVDQPRNLAKSVTVE